MSTTTQALQNFSKRTGDQAPQLVFAVLPFCQLSPALDASTLATIFRADGISSRVLYFNRKFAHVVDTNLYRAAAASISLNGLLGDWIFSEEVFGRNDDLGYLRLLVSRQYLSPDLIPAIMKAKDLVAPFLSTCMADIKWDRVEVLCLIDSFAKRNAVSGQLMASLALAQRVKKQFPNVKTLLASSSTEREMGDALKHLPYLDFVSTGDVYDFVPRTVRAWLGGRTESPPSTERALSLPIPEFDDYFELREDGLPGDFGSIPMETSRGCWWAETAHCGFCALPGADVRFRSKSPEAVVREFQVQMERYKPQSIEMHDLIIDQRYFRSVFPLLGEVLTHAEVFFETKAHLTTDQIEILSKSSVRRIQVGIESLSENALRQMSKGVSVRRNLQFLRDCNKFGIQCYWNYLHSFPGETAGELLSALPIIEASYDLPPPSTFQPVRVERFSPYFREPTKYRLTNLRPDRSYRFVYGNSEIDLNSFAFYFEHDPASCDLEMATAVTKLRNALEKWRNASGKGNKDFVSQYC